MRRVAVAAALLTAVGTASAGMMLEALILGQLSQHMKDGQVNGCGVRLFGLVVPDKVQDTEGFDVSFNLFHPGLGLVKGGGIHVTADDLANRRTGTPRPKPDVLWLRAPGATATQPRDGKYPHAEEPREATMYVTSDLAGVTALFAAIFEGKPVQVGILQHGESVERIYYGRVALKNSEMLELGACIEELSEGFKRRSGQ